MAKQQVRGGNRGVTPVTGQHRYDSCRDGECERLACRAWREAWEEARETCCPETFLEGVNACPREHK